MSPALVGWLACSATLLAACTDSTALASLTPLPAVEPGPIMQMVRSALTRDEQRLIDFRRDLHRHPELSGEEVRTAQRVADELRRLGLEVRTGVGGHGVVGLLRGARPGPLIAYRADMDAVPSSAKDPVAFASLTAGVRHICGHDIHTTVGVALAAALREVRDSLAGSVMFVFQPAEERATGAQAMLSDAVFAPIVPAAIYGLHTAPLEVGLLATTAGPMMAGRDRFSVVLSGPGDLAGAMASVRQRIATLSTMDASQITVSQPPDFIYVQMGAPQPSGAQLRLDGTVTVASAASRARVQATIESGIAAELPSGVSVSSTYEARQIAGVTNDSGLTTLAMAAVREALGASSLLRLITIPPAFSEDF
ncbi:MAG: amidohydrolase, partial [Gemmatimonadaceae bacterium]|nr:amidohydrolase [Gemmatimonadaceae bacterium]